MRITLTVLRTVAICAALATTSIADVPSNMNIQGVLTDGSGDPVSPGLRIFTFKIYDAAAGGTEVWPAGPGEDQTLATDANGLWKAALGTFEPLSAAVFADTTRWLEVTVDDGVNPPETLSRIKLNTVPFAFEAGALGGSSLDDLTDDFVNVPGDSMTGRLVIDAPWADAVGASFRTNNISDANTPTGLGGNTIAVLGDAKSDGFEGKYGIVGYAKTTADTSATVGVYGQGLGNGHFNVGVYGAVDATGSHNYSGYFYGGDFRVTTPDHPGDSAVRLPDDAISTSEILDDPGIAVNTTSTSLSGLGTAAMVDLITVTITTPADGYVVVDGSFYGWVSGSAASSATGYAQIDETAGGSQTTPYYRAWGELAPATDGNRFYPVSVSRTYSKSAGVHTFRLEVKAVTISGTGSVQAIYPTIRATYFPQAYGTVTTVMPAADASDFSQVRAVPSPSATAGGLPGLTESLVEVDLRELELRALKERLEAERAEREFAEAQLRTGPVVETNDDK